MPDSTLLIPKQLVHNWKDLEEKSRSDTYSNHIRQPILVEQTTKNQEDSSGNSSSNVRIPKQDLHRPAKLAKGNTVDTRSLLTSGSYPTQTNKGENKQSLIKQSYAGSNNSASINNNKGESISPDLINFEKTFQDSSYYNSRVKERTRNYDSNPLFYNQISKVIGDGKASGVIDIIENFPPKKFSKDKRLRAQFIGKAEVQELTPAFRKSIKNTRFQASGNFYDEESLKKERITDILGVERENPSYLPALGRAKKSILSVISPKETRFAHSVKRMLTDAEHNIIQRLSDQNLFDHKNLEHQKMLVAATEIALDRLKLDVAKSLESPDSGRLKEDVSDDSKVSQFGHSVKNKLFFADRQSNGILKNIIFGIVSGKGSKSTLNRKSAIALAFLMLIMPSYMVLGIVIADSVMHNKIGIHGIGGEQRVEQFCADTISEYINLLNAKNNLLSMNDGKLNTSASNLIDINKAISELKNSVNEEEIKEIAGENYKEDLKDLYQGNSAKLPAFLKDLDQKKTNNKAQPQPADSLDRQIMDITQEGYMRSGEESKEHRELSNISNLEEENPPHEESYRNKFIQELATGGNITDRISAWLDIGESKGVSADFFDEYPDDLNDIAYNPSEEESAGNIPLDHDLTPKIPNQRGYNAKNNKEIAEADSLTNFIAHRLESSVAKAKDSARGNLQRQAKTEEIESLKDFEAQLTNLARNKALAEDNRPSKDVITLHQTNKEPAKVKTQNSDFYIDKDQISKHIVAISDIKTANEKSVTHTNQIFNNRQTGRKPNSHLG